MTASDLLAALTPVVQALDSLGIAYYIGGSLASSAHGMPRASLDADLVASLELRHAAPLVRGLQGAYYVDEGRVREAIEARRSFNLIHLATMFKVDVFAAKRRPFDQEALQRARLRPFGDAPDAPQFRVASAEDTILAKLEWFRAGGESSDRQWADVVGVLKAVASLLDRAYLERWAPTLGVADLLSRARAESRV